MRFGRGLTVTCALVAGALAASSATADVSIYGKIHLSGDSVDNGTTSDQTLSSNSSRLGFKGEDDLKNGFKSMWQLESELDVSGESGSLKARNRYIGLSHRFGTLMIGYHDTPFKEIGGPAGIMHDTIADRRSIIGASATMGNVFDIRAKNMLMYVSPELYGAQLKILQSTGNDPLGSDTNPGVDEFPVTSTSLTYKHDLFYAGIAYQNQEEVDASGFRLGGGATYMGVSVNVLFEQLSSDTHDELDRTAYGGSAAYVWGDTTFKAQLFMVGDYKDKKDSGAGLYAVGITHKLSQSLDVYAMYAGVRNATNAAFMLPAAGHGEKYAPENSGDNLSGFSAGVTYRFLSDEI